MAKRGRTLNPGYKTGEHLSNCYRCGSTFLASKLQKTWDGFWVCDDDFEIRHPQDFLRAREDRQSANPPILHDDTSILAATATFGHSYAVVGYAEVGRAIVGSDDDMPDGTFNRNTL